VFKNAVAEEVVKLEQQGAEFKDIQHLVAGVRGRAAMKEGEIDGGIWSAGMITGLIHDIPTVAELIQRIVAEAEAIIRAKMRMIA